LPRDLTAVQHAQLLASKQNREYFLENFYKIPVVNKGAMAFPLRDFQREMFARLDATSLMIGLKARQIGWTTAGVGYALHDALFNEEHPWLFVSRTDDAAQKMLQKATYALARMPQWLKDSLPKYRPPTQEALIFANGSRIESVPATPNTGRGDAVYGVLLDEAAHMEYAAEIWAAIEPLVYGKAMMFSSANGMGNLFHDVWLDSQQDDSVWDGMFQPWSAVPERDEAWYEATKRAHRHQPWFFYQEYPTTPEEAFAKSGRVAFQSDLVAQCFEPMEPESRLRYTIDGTVSELKPGENADIEVVVWVPPHVERDENGYAIRKPNFLVAADFAEGLEHGDWTYVTGFNCNEIDGTIEQTFACKSGIPIAYSSSLLEYLGYWYHTALIIGERNNAGIMPLELLSTDAWYPRLYRMDRFAEMPSNEDRTARYGWYTDKKTKSKMINDFILALSERQVILHDPDFVIESQTFIADGKGSYGATSGHHDDVIMGTLVGWQGVLDSPSYPVVWRDNRIPIVTEADIDAIFFPKEKHVSKVNKPIGRTADVEMVKSFILTPANFN